MMRIVLMGTGNVSFHFFKALKPLKNVEIAGVYSRKSNETLREIYGGLLYDDLNKTPDADLYILAVSDDAISFLSKQLPFKNKLVLHTSGATPIKTLHHTNRRGVLYPVQSLSKGKETDYKHLPLAIEAEEEKDLELLKNLAGSISSKTFLLESEQRKQLHLAAVFVNNFVNHLYYAGQEICKEKDIPFDVLQPLIRETAEKLETLSPIEAQTGPARRNDLKSINSHLEILKQGPFEEVYKTITRSIQDTYGREKL